MRVAVILAISLSLLLILGEEEQEARATHEGPPHCAEDFNADTFIDIFDIIEVANRFGQPVPPAPAVYDLTGDGFIDIFDITKVTQYFGERCSAGEVTETYSAPTGEMVLGPSGEEISAVAGGTCTYKWFHYDLRPPVDATHLEGWIQSALFCREDTSEPIRVHCYAFVDRGYYNAQGGVDWHAWYNLVSLQSGTFVANGAVFCPDVWPLFLAWECYPTLCQSTCAPPPDACGNILDIGGNGNLVTDYPGDFCVGCLILYRVNYCYAVTSERTGWVLKGWSCLPNNSYTALP